MSAIIKSGDKALAAKVRPLAQPALPPPRGPAEVVPPETLALRREHETLVKQVQQQAEEIERLQGALVQAFEDGEAKGRQEGLREAESREADRLAALRDGVADACAGFEDAIAGLERLAPLLAIEGLEKIVGDPANYADILMGTIGQNIERLEAGGLVHVEVSRADFGDEADMASVSAGLGRVDLRVLDELDAGECRIRLRLGEMDVGLKQQWGRLRELLEGLTEPEGGA